jgi:D-amino-acid dehydrogenase
MIEASLQTSRAGILIPYCASEYALREGRDPGTRDPRVIADHLANSQSILTRLEDAYHRGGVHSWETMRLTTESIVIVGAGILGIATAYHLYREGAAVTVVDRAPEGDKASFGNAGGIAVTEIVPASVPGLAWRLPVWLLDPLGPLSVRPAHARKLVPWLWRFSQAGTPNEVSRIALALSALNNRVYTDLRPMLAETGLSGELNERGALTVYESEQGFGSDAAEWAFKRDHGIAIKNLTGKEAREMEPALGMIVRRAVFTPQWSHINDPKRMVDCLREWLRIRGVTFITGNVIGISDPGGMPQVSLQVSLAGGRSIAADKVVVAAGAWSGELAKCLGDRVLLESERGYNTTLGDPGVALNREVIFAERKFVATPLSCGLRIGGAAEFGGLHAEPNFKRCQALMTLATRYLPSLKLRGGTNWAGHRPATPDSLPVIGASPRHAQVFYAFGHGHLGLTQAATTGRLISNLIRGVPSPIDLSPYSIARFS